MARPARTEARRLAALRRELLDAESRERRRPAPGATPPPLRSKAQKALDALRARDHASGGDTFLHATVDDAEAEDRARAAVRGGTAILHAAFWVVTGPAPVCGPGDLQLAKLFWRKVLNALDQGGWTHSEHTHLMQLEAQWGKRARGEDWRFTFVGNRSGRLDRQTEKRIRILEGRAFEGEEET